MKIAKLVRIAAGGLAALALSVAFAPGAGITSDRSAEASASVQSGGQAPDPIDWP
ncbi:MULTISPECIES: hypothetical protein [unclassified Streptomyces]|uniref:hypothetical protein n=1 Tax=unclassified Streptomyces TaxID=2593676 RepID=UPI003319E9BC